MNQTSKFLRDMFKDHKKELMVIIVIATFGSLLAALIPYIYGRVFDMAIMKQTPLNILIGLIGLWFILSIFSNYTANKTALMGEVMGVKVSLEAEAKAYGHFLTLPIHFHKTQRKGKILERISRGAWRLQNMIEVVSEVLPQFLILIFSLIIVFLLQWRLAFLLIIFVFVYSYVTLKQTKPLLKLQTKEHRAFEKQYGKVYDRLYNVFLVKNFAMEEKEKESFFESLVKKLSPVINQNAKQWTRLSIIQDIIYSISFVTILGTAILLLRGGTITPGEFIMFFGYINLSFSPLRRLGGVYRVYKRSLVAIKRYVKLKKIVPEAMKHGNRTLEEVKGEIEIDKVSFSYLKDKDILKKINLKIKPGETVALVGSSGVGKTTLSELIIGYYKPQEGIIRLDGVNIKNLRLDWLRDQIAIVPQDIGLLNESLLKNLRYANPNASKKDIVKSTKAAGAHEFIMDTPKGYETKIGEKGMKLSMGQRQRLSLAMAFLKNPKILILDEPTASLDAESERKVHEGIKKLIKGRTTIIIAHRFSTVKNADKIIVLDKGKIVERGNHRELMRKKGIYYNLYSLQIDLK